MPKKNVDIRLFDAFPEYKDALVALHTEHPSYVPAALDLLRNNVRHAMADTELSAYFDNHGGDTGEDAARNESDDTEALLALARRGGAVQADAALAKLLRGTFHLCDGCMKSIPLGRKEAIPESTECIKCAEENAGGGNGHDYAPRRNGRMREIPKQDDGFDPALRTEYR